MSAPVPFSILFVCTANRFRSPLAAAAFQREIRLSGTEAHWQVGSAGSWAENGLAPAQTALQLARDLGLDLQDHRTRCVSADLLSQSDLILTMEAGQKEALRHEFAQARLRVFLLSEIADQTAYDIPDPAAAEGSTLREMAEEICHLVKIGAPKIQALTVRLHQERFPI